MITSRSRSKEAGLAESRVFTPRAMLVVLKYGSGRADVHSSGAVPGTREAIWPRDPCLGGPVNELVTPSLKDQVKDVPSSIAASKP